MDRSSSRPRSMLRARADVAEPKTGEEPPAAAVVAAAVVAAAAVATEWMVSSRRARHPRACQAATATGGDGGGGSGAGAGVIMVFRGSITGIGMVSPPPPEVASGCGCPRREDRVALTVPVETNYVRSMRFAWALVATSAGVLV